MNNNNKTSRILVILLLILSFVIIAYQLGSMNQGPQSTNEDEVMEQQEEANDSQEVDEVEEGDVPELGEIDMNEEGEGDEEPPQLDVDEDKQEGCSKEYAPVCGMLDGKKQSFDNACLAEEAGATDVQEGKCPVILAPTDELAQSCPDTNEPVCGITNGKKVNYKNECEAKKAGATEITTGQCTFDIKL